MGVRIGHEESMVREREFCVKEGETFPFTILSSLSMFYVIYLAVLFDCVAGMEILDVGMVCGE